MGTHIYFLFFISSKNPPVAYFRDTNVGKIKYNLSAKIREVKNLLKTIGDSNESMQASRFLRAGKESNVTEELLRTKKYSWKFIFEKNPDFGFCLSILFNTVSTLYPLLSPTLVPTLLVFVLGQGWYLTTKF